ncbi:MAG: ComEA family DNA-binding protein [Lachnospiraceae bacterium]|nr:ComEA family DNA-binding protein [Lachnospiraceae bacterium]
MQIKRILYKTVGPVFLNCLIGCGGPDTPVLLEPVSLTEAGAEEGSGKASDDARNGAEGTGKPADGSGKASDGAKEPEPATVMVHVCGAVAHPGVYELPADARVADAMLAAGNLTADASPDYWNQAAVLTDGEQIYVPTFEEVEAGDVLSGVSASGGAGAGDPGAAGRSAQGAAGIGATDGKVDLNTADAKLLKTLPGIGDVKANAIVAYREAHGRFSSVDEVKQVDGIKDGLFSQIEPLICVR